MVRCFGFESYMSDSDFQGFPQSREQVHSRYIPQIMEDLDEGIVMPQYGFLHLRSSCRNRHDSSHFRLEFWSQYPQQMRKIVHTPARGEHLLTRRFDGSGSIFMHLHHLHCHISRLTLRCSTPHTTEIAGQSCTHMRGFTVGEALHHWEQTRGASFALDITAVCGTTDSCFSQTIF